jgi:hypothetical protein
MNAGIKRMSFIKRIISFLLAIYLLNFSIDSHDGHPDEIAEDLSINDIETFYEFLTEHILDIENAVAEHEERDQDNGGAFEFKKFYFSPVISGIQPKNTVYIKALYSPVDYCEPLGTRFVEINSPPPEV